MKLYDNNYLNSIIRMLKKLMNCVFIISVIGFDKGFSLVNQTNGKIKKYYSISKIKSIINYKNGKKHGWSIYYGEDGRLLSKSHYLKGKLNGWSFFSPSEYFHSRSNIKIPEYPNTPYDFRIDKIQNYYVNGLKNGWGYLRRSYTESSYLYEKAMYRNGEKKGKYYSFLYVNGKVYKKKNGYYYLNKKGKMFPFMPEYIIGGPNKYLHSIKHPYVFFDNYHYDNLIDKIKKTAWVSFYKNYKMDNFNITNYSKKVVKYLIINNGNKINRKEYYRFSRIKKIIIKLYINSKIIRKVIKFKDNFLETKKIPIFKKGFFNLFIYIDSIYPGKTYRNLSVSDIYLEY